MTTVPAETSTSAILSAMAHRPYPVAARAWRHILRRYRYERPAHSPAAPPQGPVGEYRLSMHAGR